MHDESDAPATRNGDRPAQDEPRTLTRRGALRAAGAGVGAALLGTTAAPAAAQDGLPRLSVDGNELVTDEGEAVTLRGVNVIDPKRANRMAPLRGRDAAQQLDLVTGEGWHPDVIRLPVQPVDVGEHQPGSGPEPPAFDDAQLEAYLETHLDPIVQQCADAGVYCIVDYHRHRDVAWGDQDEGTVNQALLDETIGFWETVAPRYAEDDHVLYEMYNEPTEPGMWGAIGQDWVDSVWELFLEFAQPIVDEIRSHADNVVLVSSPGWTQSPQGALIEPVDGENLAYTYHIYPGHEVSQEQNWEDSGINGQGVEAVYEEYPLFVTEFGWRDYDDDLLGGTTESFGRPFLEWLESHDSIHWTAWVADPLWEPAAFEPGFEGWDHEVDHVYEDEIPVACEERPCEWRLLGAEAGTTADMGEYVRLALEADGVPEGYLDDGEAADGESEDGETDDASDDSADGDESADDEDADATSGDGSDESDDDGLPGFGVGAGVAGVAGGLGYALRGRTAGEPVED